MAVTSLKCSLAVAGTARFIFVSPHLNNFLGPVVLRTISYYPNKLRRNTNVGLARLPKNAQPFCKLPRSSYSSIYSNRYPISQDFISLNGLSHFSTGQSEPEKKLTLIQRFKHMYRDYWYVLVPVHAVTSLAWFGGFYYLLQSGVDVVAILESYDISETLLKPLRDSKAGYLAISYALYKIFTPIRYTVTLGGTTISINYLQKWGYIKPIPSGIKLKEMYQERKETLIERRDNIKADLIERKDNIIESVRETAGELKHKTDHLADRAANAAAIADSEKRNVKQRRDALVGGKGSIVDEKGNPR